MTTFVRLLTESDKASLLRETCSAIRRGLEDNRVFHVDPNAFREIPSAPFAYWASKNVRAMFSRNPAFQSEDRHVRQGLATANDFRFVRAWWEHEGIKENGFAR